MQQEQNLTYLGEKFEPKFWKEFIGRRIEKGKEVFRDCNFGLSILNILEEKHFHLEYSKMLLQLIKKFYEKYKTIPFYDTLRELVSTEFPNQKQTFYQFLSDVESVVIDNSDFIRESAEGLIKQQNFSAAVKEFEKRLKLGKAKSFEEGVDLIRRAIQVNNSLNKATQIKSESFEVVTDANRIPIPTGMGKCFDDRIKGGLSRGDLGVFCAGTKVGKTTFAAIQASQAFKEGKTVVYIYFEGKESSEIIGKFQAVWSGLTIDESKVEKNKSYVTKECKKFIKNAEERQGKLFLKKFDSVKTTWPQIESFLYNLEIVEGNKIDMVLIDYLELIQPVTDRDYGDKVYDAHADILREIENLIDEKRMNCAAWVFVQGTKDTNGKEDLTLENMGGSRRIPQIAHLLVMVGKSFEQAEKGLSTMKILGNRLGYTAKFKDIIYDNAKVKIYVEDVNIVNTVEKPKKKKNEFDF